MELQCTVEIYNLSKYDVGIGYNKEGNIKVYIPQLGRYIYSLSRFALVFNCGSSNHDILHWLDAGKIYYSIT